MAISYRLFLIVTQNCYPKSDTFLYNVFIMLHQVSKIKQEYNLKEKLLKTRVEELEEYSRSSNHELTQLLTAQQNCIQRLKEESKNAVQCFETNVAKLE